MKVAPFPFVALVATLSLLFASCADTTSTTTQTQAAGHAITAVIEGEPSVESLPTHAIIRSPFGLVTIEPARVRLEDLAWTAIPPDVPVFVSITKNTLRVTAGNITIRRTISR